MKLIYAGPLEGVRLHQCGVTAERGKAVEVPDDLAESLIEQGWTKPAAKSDAAKKAAPATNTKES